MKKRIFSILTALALCLTLLPAAALADSTPTYDLWKGDDGGLYYGDANDETKGTKVVQNPERGEFGNSFAGNYMFPEGSYTLAGDITISDPIAFGFQYNSEANNTTAVGGTFSLDLNGHVLQMTGGNDAIKVASGGHLTLKDSAPTAGHDDNSLPAGGILTSNSRGVGVSAGGSFTMKGGSIANCGGSGVYVVGSFTMEGGSIANCGGGVYVVGSFTMKDGSITGRTTGGDGDGVFVMGGGTFQMYGGTITGKNTNAVLYLDPDPDAKPEVSDSTYPTSMEASGGVVNGAVRNDSCTTSAGTSDSTISNPSGSSTTQFNGAVTNNGGTISSGEYNEKVTNNGGTISGGTFHGEVTNNSTIIGGTIIGGTITGGTFKSMVTNDNNCTISDGTFESEVINSGEINDGTFCGTVVNNGTITGGTFYGTVTGDIADSAKVAVTFDLNGADGTVPAEQKVLRGQKATEPVVPTREDHTFGGWYTDEGCTKKFSFDSSVTEPLTLYAKWTANEAGYTILCYRMDTEGNYPGEPTDTITRTGTVGSTVDVPARSDNGFYVDTEKSDASGIVRADGTLVLKQYLARRQYTVTYDSNGGSAAATQTYYYGQSMTAPEEPTREGYEFLGWCEESKFTYPDIDSMELYTFGTMPAKGLTLKAVWQRKLSECTITVNDLIYTGKEQKVDITITDGDKTLVEGTDYGLLNDGDSVVYATKPGTYELTIRGSWAYCETVTVTWSIVKENYEAPTYSISTPKTENGTIKVTPKNAARTTTVTVTATPDAGYALESLTVYDEKGNEIELKDLGNGKYTFKMPGGEVELEAQFAPIQTGSKGDVTISFADVSENDYFYDAVRWAVEKGITTGVDDAHFGPHDSCTRSQLAVFLYRYVQSQSGGFTGHWAMQIPFADLQDWDYEAVAWCYMNGIVSGYGNGLFGAGDEITREQVVTILYRFAVAMGMDVSVGEDTNILSYNDAFDVSEYAIEAFQWAVGAGIVQGDGGDLMPNAVCTRAQIVTMLYRLLGE